jgi:hypothetical protein
MRHPPLALDRPEWFRHRFLTVATAGYLIGWARMIRLESISKQNGKQIVFIEASATVQRARRSASSAPTAPARRRSSA